ncbi:Rax2p [Saccharomyces eubayanus]|uniref:Rax2p n=1 Tax=Saccharomyces eubayanus TaxID=1080349 RepID=UPI0006BF9DFC|nr:RAX2-like protein [Saccharomyces eubayanus]KOG97796.1 RAX2-like protein [Saccharomyces eubayanus]
MFVHRLWTLVLPLLTLGSKASQLQSIKSLLDIEDNVLPNLNISQDNDNAVQILGGVEALSLYKYIGQQNFTKEIGPETNSRGLVYYSNDTYILLEDADDDTRIDRITPFGTDSFILSGSGSIKDVPLGNQILYNLSTLSMERIFTQPLGHVEAVLVNDTSVYFGGNFSYNNGSMTGHGALVWESTSNTTQLLPFGGFGKDSYVNSIVKLNDDNILFAGKFYTLDDSSILTTSSKNTTSATSALNATTLELGQRIPLRYASWESQGSTTFESSYLVCPDTDKDAWTYPGTSGSLVCTLPYEVAPTKIRLYNSPNSNNEISLFQILTNPSRSIMNLTYLDPISGELQNCDEFCPLYSRDTLLSASQNVSSSLDMISFIDNNNTDVKWSSDFQDFAFANEVAVTSLKLTALNSYGDNVALSGLELYQDTFSTYANNSLNEYGCSALANDSSSSTLSDNEWYDGLTGQSYIAIDYVPNQNKPTPTVTFYPSIIHPGHYTINTYTPGCVQDNTCSSRGIVNVTMWNPQNNTMMETYLIYQNNDNLKYDKIYSGYLDFSPEIVMEYVSGIYASNTATIMVADQVNIITDSLDSFSSLSETTTTKRHTPLNGVLQYQRSNFTAPTSNEMKIANTTLNLFSVDNYPKNSSIFADIYDTKLILGGADNHISVIDFNESLRVTASENKTIQGDVYGMTQTNQGLLIFGDLRSSDDKPTVLMFNGSFENLSNYSKTVDNAINISLANNDLIVFNNNYILNTSSNSEISNSSSFSLSLWSAGNNGNGDVLFSGAVSQMQFSDLSGSARFLNEDIVEALNLNKGIVPYLGAYLNESTIAYAYETDSLSKIYFSNNVNPSWNWSNNITKMVYANNQTLLAVGSESSTTAELSIFNLKNFTTIANETIGSNAKINAFVNFEKNSSLLVGGDFQMSKPNCSGLCLYNYESKIWSAFLNNTIFGEITELTFNNESELIISGLFATEKYQSIRLGSFNLTNSTMIPLLTGSGGKIKSFTVTEDSIVAWNDTSLLIYRDQKWNITSLPGNGSSVSSVTTINTNADSYTLSKRATDNVEKGSILLLNGNFSIPQYGNLQGLLFDSQNWTPYFTSEASEASGHNPTIFINRDVSAEFNSQIPLSNSNMTVTSPQSTSPLSPSSSASSESNKKSKKKNIDRGFVVLIGLALALGTVSVLGIAGVILAYVFKDPEGDYKPIKPRIDENEMLDTVPPEKLMKFV